MATGTKVAELYGELNLDKSNFERDINSSGGLFGGLADLAKKAAIGVGLALAGIALAAGGMAIDFQRSMANVHTLLGSGSEAERRIDELSQDVKDMSIETGKSLDDLSGGLYMVISAFGDTAESSDILRLAAKASTAGLASTADAVNLLSAVTKGYGDSSAAAVEHASDLAFQTVRLGQTTFPELAASMGKAVPLGNALGVSMEELFGAMATLTGVTGNTAEVATQLRGTFQAIVAGNPNMVAALKALGYESGQAAVEQLGLAGTLNALNESTGGSTVKLREMFGSVEAVNAVLALTGPQADDFAAKTAAMGDAAGQTATAFDIQQQTVGASMDRINAAFGVVLVTLGEKFLPMLQSVLDWVLANLPAIQATFEGVFAVVGELLGGAVDLAKGLLGAFEDILSPTEELGTSLSGLASGALTDLQGLFEWLQENVGPTVQPVLDMLGALVGLLASLANEIIPPLQTVLSDLIEKVFKPLAEGALKTLAETVLPAVTGGFNFLATTVAPLLGEVLQGVADGFGAILDFAKPLIDFLAEHGEIVLGAIATVITIKVVPALLAMAAGGWAAYGPLLLLIGIIALVALGVDALSDSWEAGKQKGHDWTQAIKDATQALKDGKEPIDVQKMAIDDLVTMLQTRGIFGLTEFASAANTMADDFSASGSWVQDELNAMISGLIGFKVTGTTVMETMGQAFSGIVARVTGTISSIVQNVRSAITDTANHVIDIINDMIRMVNRFQIHIPAMKVGDFVISPAFDWGGLNIPQLGHLALGTRDWPGGFALLGERGPELSYLPPHTQVFPADETREMLKGGGGPGMQQVNVTVLGDARPDTPADIGLEMRKLGRLGISPRPGYRTGATA